MIRSGAAAALALFLMSLAAGSRAEDGTATVRLYAAGSLKAALTDAARAFTIARGVKVEAVFGPSGLLREQLEAGQAAGGGGVFVSADLKNPLMLERDGKAGPVVLVARNRLCALARPGLPVTSETLLDAMLDPAIKLGTSTPKADPSGDYAWEVFRKAEALRPGSRERLEGKALKLVGGPESAKPPEGVTAYAWHVREGRADLFLTYCTSARTATTEMPGAKVVDLPPDLATGAEYGLTVLKSADDKGEGASLAFFLLSPEGQNILAKQGFDSPLLPRGSP